MNQKVYLDSVGCRLNQSEIAQMGRQFEQVGYEIVENPQEADLFVVNTCAVTNAAGKDSRKMVRNLHRQNEAAQIAVTGCYSQVAPQIVAKLPNVQFVVDNLKKDDLVAQVTGQQPETFDLEPVQRTYAPGAAGLTRAFVKVQDGCDNECTFCITRVARGAGRSRPMEEIIREVQWMYDGGYREIVLTGVHLGSYGHDLGNPHGLYDLVEALLNATPMPRIRLSSLEPWDLAPNFFSLWADPRLCRHLHLPLQSGCDRTLKRMRRNTNQAAFRELVEAARAHIPDLALSTDLIVGFPQEDETEFAESYAFTREMDFMKIHVFPYSVREGTPAAKMRGRVKPEVAKERVHQIQTLSDEGGRRFMLNQVGKTQAVIWEQIRGASEAGFWHTGLTDNYLRVEMVHPQVLTNTITNTRLMSLSETGIIGEMVG